jgi:hypothetical protein
MRINKLILGFSALFAALSIVPALPAQDFNHGEVGAFADYFRLGQTGNNFVGIGGRAGVNVTSFVQFEAEMSYDFNQVFTEGFQNTSGGTATFASSNMRVLHGLFGPKIQTKGPVKFFLTAKGGFVNFRFDPVPASFGTFTSSVDNLRTTSVSAAFYPGGGFEAYIGPVGLRLDVGDEMYFAGGTHHNLRISFGPQIRF